MDDATSDEGRDPSHGAKDASPASDTAALSCENNDDANGNVSVPTLPSIGLYFLAFDLSDNVLDALDGHVATMQQQQPKLRWSARSRWHVTILFLGTNVEAGLVERIQATLRLLFDEQKPKGFPVRIQRVGCFPKAARANVLWCGVSEDDNEGLGTVRQPINTGLGATWYIRQPP